MKMVNVLKFLKLSKMHLRHQKYAAIVLRQDALKLRHKTFIKLENRCIYLYFKVFDLEL